MKIVGVFPLTGNGGIASWTKKYLATFPDKDFVIRSISNSPTKPRGENDSICMRMWTGWKDQQRVCRELKTLLKSDSFDILHTTTSGSIGSYRDYKVAKICKKHNIKSILHCRYGCITEEIKSKGAIGWILRKSFNSFDQIWVLDSRSYATLKAYPSLSDKVFLTPNSIEVKEPIDRNAKSYKRVAFIGNLIPTKGLYELVEACKSLDVRLDIIGPGFPEVVAKVKRLAGEKLDKTIFVHGKMPNDEVMVFMHEIDIVALPTYYNQEAFPISILEAMSLTKMVISCPRAAVKDMLTDVDGKPCGMLVKPKSATAIADAIIWCQENKKEADLMCQKAYEKVKAFYSKEVIYELYRSQYKLLYDKK